MSCGRCCGKASILSKCHPVLRKLSDGTGSQIQNLVKRMQKDVQNLMKLLPHRLRKKRSKKWPQNVAKNIDPKTDPKTDPKIFKGKSFLFFFGSVFGSVFGSHFSQNWIGFWTRFWTRFGIRFSTTFGYERQKKLDTFPSGCSSDVKSFFFSCCQPADMKYHLLQSESDWSRLLLSICWLGLRRVGCCCNAFSEWVSRSWVVKRVSESLLSMRKSTYQMATPPKENGVFVANRNKTEQNGFPKSAPGIFL